MPRVPPPSMLKMLMPAVAGCSTATSNASVVAASIEPSASIERLVIPVARDVAVRDYCKWVESKEDPKPGLAGKESISEPSERWSCRS
ncbi:predicted protein [Uncinocarpus reesii 1704]|uniref:Uncharacterized protein n=1 Tax=Uncinocarpus reesii (strain UAMH 1704) TaxID=336963 RepID=C4JJI7_UNCRE|nr:uncharacterized protein UREG_01794 [Uncinocarpus reesii 1704]EEP76945.1 predicted protein [Uncinocarpus reesii 1704]